MKRLIRHMKKFFRKEAPARPSSEDHWGVSDGHLAAYVRKHLHSRKDGLKMDVSFTALIDYIRKNPRYFHKLRCRPGEMKAYIPWKGNIGALAYIKAATPEDAVRRLKRALEVLPDGPWIENIFFCIKANGKLFAILDDTSHVKSLLKVEDRPDGFLVSYSLGKDKKPQSIAGILREEDRYTLYPKGVLDDKTIVDRHEKKVIQ